MAVTATPIFPQLIQSPVAQILPADTTTLKTIVTAGADGTRVDRILVSYTDSGSRDLQFVITSGGTDYILCTMTLPANSGNLAAVPPLSVFDHANMVGLLNDVNGNKVLFLGSGAVLKCKVTSSVAAAKIVAFNVQLGNF